MHCGAFWSKIKKNRNSGAMITKRYMRNALAALLAAVSFLACGCQRDTGVIAPSTVPAQTTEPTVVVETEPPHHWETGYISTLSLDAAYCDEAGNPLGTLIRGTQVEYELTPEGGYLLRMEDDVAWLEAGASIVPEVEQSIPVHTLYIRSTVNLRDAQGRLLETLGEKGTAVQVTGCDDLHQDGQPHMYRVELDGTEGYIMPWYLADNETDALAPYDSGSYAIHADRGNRYGGGGAADLDYYPREKGAIENNAMPEEVRSLYLVNWRLDEVDAYIAIADASGINAFVVDIVDGSAVGYASDVMNAYSPTAASMAGNTVEAYQAAIRKIKEAGYYVIGRITTFNDTCFVQDHPEYAITDGGGQPLRLSGEYWPSPYQRAVWQYKVDLAVEAVELMGFDEIQFDYVRFPDNTGRYENAGNIDFRNTYGETKAQAIQRFLMYATDILHEHGAYVSADVYGESAFTYVTAYGQYWPAISNTVDVISGMPYPDHFGASGSWLPWEHPYETLYDWGQCVMVRQSETATPATVRTWIQAYNAIREPYTQYGPDQVFSQICALRDSGCTGGYMTWNANSSQDKYNWLIPAFAPPPEN